MMPPRIPNWDLALLEWAERQLGRPFAWGTTDCTTLLHDGLAVMYGGPVGPEIPAYDTLAGATRVLKQLGGAVPQLLQMGAERVGPGFARSGDVVVIPAAEGEITDVAALVVRARTLTVAPGETVEWGPIPAPDAPAAYVLRLPHGW